MNVESPPVAATHDLLAVDLTFGGQVAVLVGAARIHRAKLPRRGPPDDDLGFVVGGVCAHGVNDGAGRQTIGAANGTPRGILGQSAHTAEGIVRG